MGRLRLPMLHPHQNNLCEERSDEASGNTHIGLANGAPDIIIH